MMRPFLICALPRSRTAWLAQLLTWGRVRCGHERSAGLSGPEELVARLRAPQAGVSFAGNADTAQAQWWPALREALPDAAVVVVRRPADEVAAALQRLGFPQAEAAVKWLRPRLDAVAETRGALVLDFDELNRPAVVRKIWEHVAPGEPFDAARAERLQRWRLELTRERLREVVRLAAGRWPVCGET